MSANDATIEYHFCGYKLDARQRKLFNPDGESVCLSSRAFDTLLVLLEKQGETLTKTQIMELVWPNSVVEENNLNQAIHCLRKALGNTREENCFIVTVPGRGYCFVAPVEASTVPDQQKAAIAEAPATLRGTLEPGTLPPVVTGFQPKVLLPRVALFVMLLVVGASLSLYRPDILPTETQPASTPRLSAQVNAVAPPVDIIVNSVAVLPFINLNPDEHTELFALGLHDETINQLAKIKSLKVMARGSVVGLVKQQYSMTEIARRLRVQSLMTGNIMFVDEKARISIQMLDASSGITLWARTYEAGKDDLAEMISIQSDIALHVATTLKAEIEQSEHEKIAALPTRSFEAYRYNMAARLAHYHQDYVQVWNLAQQAIALDPGYYDAHYTFASANTALVATPLSGMTSHEHFDLALASAENLIAIDPRRSEGYALKAVALATSKDWLGASAMLTQLQNMKLPAGDLKFVSLLYMCIGNFERAIEIYEANLVTEPLNLYGRGFLLAAHELTGDREASRREYELGEELSPLWWGDIVNIFLALGRQETLQDVDALVGVSDQLKYLLLHLQNVDFVKSQLQIFMESDAKVAAEAMYYAAIAAHAGEHELSVELMRIGLDDVWTGLFWLWLPVFDETRKLHSFGQLLRDSGVVGYWQLKGWPEVCQPKGASFSCEWHASADWPVAN